MGYKLKIGWKLGNFNRYKMIKFLAAQWNNKIKRFGLNVSHCDGHLTDISKHAVTFDAAPKLLVEMQWASRLVVRTQVVVLLVRHTAGDGTYLTHGSATVVFCMVIIRLVRGPTSPMAVQMCFLHGDPENWLLSIKLSKPFYRHLTLSNCTDK